MYKNPGPAFGPPAEVLMNQSSSKTAKEGKTRRFSLPIKWTRQLMNPKGRRTKDPRSSSVSPERSMDSPEIGVDCNSQLLEDQTSPGVESPSSPDVYQRRHLNAPQPLFGSQEELNRQFASFDKYLTGLEEAVNRDIPPAELPSLDQIRRQPDNQTPSSEALRLPPVHPPLTRQRSKSETQRPHLADLQLPMRPRPLVRRRAQSILPAPGNIFPASPSGSTQDLRSVSRGKTSLELLPEGIPVHYSGPVRCASPAIPVVDGLADQPSDRLNRVISADDVTITGAEVSAILGEVKGGRSRSWTSSAATGPTNRSGARNNAGYDGTRRGQNEDLNEDEHRGRQRSWTFSVQRPTLVKEKSKDVALTSDHKKESINKRRKFGSALLPIFNRTRTKSRSVDQSLAAAFDVDVIGGLSRLAGVGGGSATGTTGSECGSAGSGGTVRPTSPSLPGTGEKPASAGSTGRLVEETTSYIVQNSDTLTSVAARFDTTPSELASLNKLHSRLIFPGQVLQVPRKDVGSSASAGEAGPGDAASSTSPLFVSVSNSNESSCEAAQANLPSPVEKAGDDAFLDSLRPPGSPRFSSRSDHSAAAANGSAADGSQIGNSETDQWLSTKQVDNEAVVDVEAERVKDRGAYDKFLKINVRHITDGLGIVSGVLLVTPNTVMFDPNVSDTLVIEHGAEAYGVIAPIEFVVNAALFSDIAHKRNGDSKDDEPIYFPDNCPLHRKYAMLKKKSMQQDPAATGAASGYDAAPDALGAPATQSSTNENDPNAPVKQDGNQVGAKVDTDQNPNAEAATQAASAGTGRPESVKTENQSHARATATDNTTVVQLTRKHSGVTAEPNLATVVECDPGVGTDEHVIRLEVKAEPSVGTSSGESVSRSGSVGAVKEDEGMMDSPLNRSFRSPLSSTRTKTPSDGNEDQLEHSPYHFNDEMSASDVFIPGETETTSWRGQGSTTESGFEEAISEAQKDETEYRLRHFSAGATSLNQSISRSRGAVGRTQGTGSLSESATSRHHSGSDPTSVTHRNQSGSPGPMSSSPESRGQRMLKRLSYPLVWMGESLSSEPRESTPPPMMTASSEPSNQESVFSKVFSRRLSTEASTKVESRRGVPNLFRGGKESGAAGATTSTSGPPKLGYRSMVSVDDVPELFASIDKLIPKPAQPCEAPPLYLRLRMGKPVDRKMPMTTPIMSYGKKKMKPEYWFCIPRDKADSICRFFLLWAPEVYGEVTDADLAARGFELITQDLEWEEPVRQHRPKPLKKLKLKKNRPRDLAGAVAGDPDQEEDDDDPLNMTAELAKESWEIVSLNEEVRRALYGSSIGSLDLDAYLPDLIGPSEILTDEHRKQLGKHLPARVEGYPWTLVFSTSQNGFSLNSLYRKMAGVDSPILLIIEDTQGNVFGAMTSCELRVSESFYGTGESFIFLFNPKLHVYSWTGENSYFIKGNNESLAIGAGDGRFGLWLDGDLNQGRSQPCKTFGNDPLSPDEDFWVKTLECWAFM